MCGFVVLDTVCNNSYGCDIVTRTAARTVTGTWRAP